MSATTLATTRAGRIVAIAATAHHLRVAVQRHHQVELHDGAATVAVHAAPATARARVSVVGDDLAVVAGGVVRGPGTRTRICDVAEGATAFAAHDDLAVWLQGGVLYTDGALGPRVLGRLLQGRTRLWLGAGFGVALSMVGDTPVAATFTPRASGIRDGIRLPGVKGRLLDAWCVFAADTAWLFVHCMLSGRERVHVVVFDRTGHIESSTHGDAGDPELAWAMSARGACAAGSILLTPTDDGIVRVETRAGSIAPTRRFPDTAEFVDAGTTLVASPMGLLAVTDRSVRQLALT